MIKIIVVQYDQAGLRRACNAVDDRDMEPIPCDCIRDVIKAFVEHPDAAGVLTDAFIPYNFNEGIDGGCGLFVVLKALEKKLPVIICSDITGNYYLLACDIISAFEKATGEKIKGFIGDGKDYQKALDILFG